MQDCSISSALAMEILQSCTTQPRLLDRYCTNGCETVISATVCVGWLIITWQRRCVHMATLYISLANISFGLNNILYNKQQQQQLQQNTGPLYCEEQAPIPLTIYRPNSKFDQNVPCSGLKCTLPISTKFCTYHDSVTAVMCAKFLCDRLDIF